MSDTGPRAQQREAARQVLDGGLDVDLSSPPSRADLALPESSSSTVLQNRDRSEFDATVRFTDGRVLDTRAYAAAVQAPGGDAAPDRLALRRRGLSLAELERLLRDATEELGADRAAVDSYLAQAARATEQQADVVRSIPTGVRGEEELVIEPVVTAAEGRVSVNYLIRWGAES